MKKICIICLAVVFSFCSCSEEQGSSVASNDMDFKLESTLSDTSYDLLSEKALAVVNTRATLNDENVCRETLKPFVEDGRNIRAQILKQLNDVGNSDGLAFWNELTEEELASLSFIVYNVNAIEAMDVNVTRARSRLTPNRMRNCLSAAIGLTAIRELGVRGVISATTLRRALFAIGKRYLGYIGVALMVADFYDCMYDE